MNAELDPTRLAELREHPSKRAPAEFRRSVPARLLRSRDKEPFGARLRPWWPLAPFGRTALGATLCVAATVALHLGSRELSVDTSRMLGPEPPLEAAGGARKAMHCPLEDLPPGLTYEPTRMELETARAGLRLDTFVMQIPGCPPLVRRMLIYVPRMALRGPLPVLIVLHDGGGSAESVRALQAQASFEAQAEMDGFIVVYANAAPSEGRFPNSGFWQTDAGANRAIDDFAYLARVVERLGEHWRIEPGGPGLDVYLVGYGSGGQLALEAAAQHPERYVGVAAILPDKVNRSRPPLRRADTRLSRLLFVTLQEHHPGTRGAIQGEGRYWPGAPLDAARLDEWKGTIGLSEVTMRAQAKLDRPIQDQRPLRRVAVTGTALLPRRVVPAGTRMFTSSFPDQRGIAVCALVVPRKSAIEVGPGGRPAPLDVARIVRAFFFEGGVPGNPGAAGP